MCNERHIDATHIFICLNLTPPARCQYVIDGVGEGTVVLDRTSTTSAQDKTTEQWERESEGESARESTSLGGWIEHFCVFGQELFNLGDRRRRNCNHGSVLLPLGQSSITTGVTTPSTPCFAFVHLGEWVNFTMTTTTAFQMESTTRMNLKHEASDNTFSKAKITSLVFFVLDNVTIRGKVSSHVC